LFCLPRPTVPHLTDGPPQQTYWQTETGSHVITPLAGVTPTKPGSASLPFFGIEPSIIDPVSGEEIHGNDVEGVLAFKQPWPSMARTVWGAHKRYRDTYLNVYKGYYVSFSFLPNKLLCDCQPN
jgi:acetyl-CoA synthetase